MNSFSSKRSIFLSHSLLANVRERDPATWVQFCLQIHSELTGIARAVQRRKGGSPDGGVNGESDLVQSVAAQILAKPHEKLANVFTVGELRGRLFALVTQKWIDKCRRSNRDKRGSGRVRQASQIGDPDDSSPLNVAHRGFGGLTDPTADHVSESVDELLSVFEPGSERQQILLMTLAGLTQEEIGRELDLSRDAVGRRVRNSIIPALRAKFAASDDTPPSDGP